MISDGKAVKTEHKNAHQYSAVGICVLGPTCMTNGRARSTIRKRNAAMRSLTPRRALQTSVRYDRSITVPRGSTTCNIASPPLRANKNSASRLPYTPEIRMNQELDIYLVNVKITLYYCKNSKAIK
jgi:hypothetical protein